MMAKVAYESTTSFSSSYSSGKKIGGSGSLGSTNYSAPKRKRLQLNNTLIKAEYNADKQPLNKDINRSDKPLDKPFAIIKTQKNKSLSHMKDRRITRYNIRGK